MSDVQERVSLIDWGHAMDRALRGGRPHAAAAIADVILRRFPRHLATYARLLEVAWQLRRWAEGEEWGRRLLQADPGSAPAWRAVAAGLEMREERARAHAAWQRAFDCAPFDPDIRAGLNRTNLAAGDPLQLNQACLAQLHLRGYHWRQAATIYRDLVETNPRRSDYLLGLMLALWRQGQQDDAYQAGRFVVRNHPHSLLAWAVVASAGDETDRALAQHPIMTMDPDGEYVRLRLRLEQAPPAERQTMQKMPARLTLLSVTAQEAELLA